MNKKSANSLDTILSTVSEEMGVFENKLIKLFKEKNSLVNDISKYVVSAGGKRLRPALTFLFAKMTTQNITPEHYEIAKATELIHNATLVHDDIIDDADLRRNKTVIHKKWDTQTAVLAGDYLMAKALSALTKTKSTETLNIFSRAMEEICEGEIEQNLNSDLDSMPDYIERITRKTAMLFCAATQSASATNKTEAKNYALNLGIAFQITDDLLAFQQDYNEKNQDADFKNNLFTAPVLFAIEEGVELNFNADFGEFRKKIISSNALNQSENLALKYANQAIHSLDVFEDNEYKRALTNLAKYISSREI